ncbi:MAG: pyrroline-5-carboxylate reductase [Pseudomonadales bacterium]|nr:pyrroline-5-carboxylate reductase [Pseudomonadales bacterium]
MTTTTFIGAGKIAQAIMGGYLNSLQSATSEQHQSSMDQIIASDPVAEQLAQLPAQITTMADNKNAIVKADVVVLCVKPNMMEEICLPLKNQAKDKLFISVAAGITTKSLAHWLGDSTSIIRCMPNTPALVQQGMTGLFANSRVSESQKTIAEAILQSVGLTEWFEKEDALDAVTAISGSGPAYYFLVMEAMQNAAIALGLSTEVSRKLVLQTALGAAQMASESELDTEQLRTNVTSPGGTTAAALEQLIEAGLPDSFDKAIIAAFKRSKELSDE